MNSIPPEQVTMPRRLPPRHRWSFEELEDRTLLSTGPGIDFGDALPLQGSTDTVTGMIAPGAPSSSGSLRMRAAG